MQIFSENVLKFLEIWYQNLSHFKRMTFWNIVSNASYVIEPTINILSFFMYLRWILTVA